MDLITILIVATSMCLIILVPGLTLSLAIFPRKNDLDLIDRLGLSLILGLTPQFLLYFADKNLHTPITGLNTYLIIFLLSFTGIIIYWLRTKTRETTPPQTTF